MTVNLYEDGLFFAVIVITIVTAHKTGFACDNPFHSREPDEVEQREYAWCVEKGFHTEVGSKKAVPEHYPVNKGLKRIHLGFENRSFVELDFLVACEFGKADLACSRNFMLTGKAPQCTQLVTDKDNDGVCDKLDECMWDPNDEKDSSTGTCVINTEVRNIDGA